MYVLSSETTENTTQDDRQNRYFSACHQSHRAHSCQPVQHGWLCFCAKNEQAIVTDLSHDSSSGSPIVYRYGVTEIPEHLLKRSQERRAAAAGETASGQPASGATPATTSNAPAVAPKAAAPVVAQAPKPVSPSVAAANARKKIPYWAMATLSLLPLWAFMYFIALKPSNVVAAGPLSIGAEVFGGCAGCHGAQGAGGAGRVLYQGEVLKTFPKIEDMLNFVYTGSQKYVSDGLAIYGNPDREGGAHAPLSYNGNPMPMQGEKAGGGLTDEEILSVVCYGRYVISGADPKSEKWEKEYETWCSPESEIFIGLETGSTSFDSIDKDFASLPDKPGFVGTEARASITG